MASVTDEILRYPFADDGALDVDRRFQDMQRRPPVMVQMPYGPPCWLATRYDDVRTIFCDRRFSRVRPEGTEAPGVTFGPNMVDTTFPLGMDAPQHTKTRRVTAPAFSPRSIRSMRDQVQEVVDRLLDEMAGAGRGFDFSARFAWQLPIITLTLLLGVPTEDADSFRVWVETSTDEREPAAARAAAHAKTNEYVATLIATRRAERHDDLLGTLVEACDAEQRISEGELFGIIMSLVSGGFETTATQLGSTVFTLMTRRDHWQELLEGRAEVPAALDELWRWIPAFRYGTTFPRWAHEDVELADGFVVRAGEAVLPEMPVANRDEAVFPHGWELDFHRVDPRPHLALGFGEHLCMGIHLAKLQVELTVRSLLQRFPTLELAIPPAQVEWPTWMFMRTVGALPLTW